MAVYHLLLAVCLVESSIAILTWPCPLECVCQGGTRVVNCTLSGRPLAAVLPALPPSIDLLLVEGARVTVDNASALAPPVHVKDLRLSGAVADEQVLSTLLSSFAPGTRSISVRHSGLRALVSSTFPPALHLTRLDLSHNALRALTGGAFGEAGALPALRDLDLSHNELEVVDASLLRRLTSLRSLHLQHNRLTAVAPAAFTGLMLLSLVDLEGNALRELREELVEPPHALEGLRLAGNPWDCHCGMQWVRALVGSGGVNVSGVVCGAPPELAGMPLESVRPERLRCVAATAHLELNVSVIHHMQGAVIDCHASGYPRPSVYWLTPHGPLLHPAHARWMPLDVLRAAPPVSRSFVGEPTYYESRVEALPNGSLRVFQLRNYFCGRYTCVAHGVASEANATVRVDIVSGISHYLTAAAVLGAATAGCLLAFAVCVCLLHMCVNRVCAKPRSHVKVLSVVIEPRDGLGVIDDAAVICDHVIGADVTISDVKISDAMLHDPMIFYPMNSHPSISIPSISYPSISNPTISYPTISDPISSDPTLPADLISSDHMIPGDPIAYDLMFPGDLLASNPAISQLGDEPPLQNSPLTPEAGSAPGTPNTRYMLEDVRARLRVGVESGVGRLRTGAQSMRTTSSRRIQTMRDSTSQYAQSMRDSSTHYAHAVRMSSARYMRTLRDSSSGCAQRVRSGMVMGVEQMKEHVHSMMELCGTGEMIQTVSMVSVSTDVDSRCRVQVVKNISFI